MKDNIVKKVGK